MELVKILQIIFKQIMKETVFITGGAGFIGFHLIKEVDKK